MCQWSGDANSNSSLSLVSENSGVNVSSHVEFSGFIVDVVEQLAREIPFQFEWLVDRRRTARRTPADTVLLRRVLAGVRLIYSRIKNISADVQVYQKIMCGL